MGGAGGRWASPGGCVTSSSRHFCRFLEGTKDLLQIGLLTICYLKYELSENIVSKTQNKDGLHESMSQPRAKEGLTQLESLSCTRHCGE